MESTEHHSLQHLPSDTALVNFLHCERLLLLSTFCFPSFNHSSTSYPMRVYIPREPLGKKLASRPFSRISRCLYALRPSCLHTRQLLQRPLIEFQQEDNVGGRKWARGWKCQYYLSFAKEPSGYRVCAGCWKTLLHCLLSLVGFDIATPREPF